MAPPTRNIKPEQLLRASEILKAVGHPTRLEILELLEVHESLSVSSIQGSLRVQVEQSMLSHHLIKMKDKGVLKCEKRGLNMYYSLVDKKILRIFDCLENCSFIE